MSLGEIVRDTRERMRVIEAPRIDPAGKRVLLVYEFAGLGDVVLLAPVIKALAARKPARIGVVIPENAARILARSGLRVTRHVPGSKLPAYDIAVDLTHRDGHDARAALACAPVKLGWIDQGEITALDHGTPDVRTFADRHWSRATALPLLPLGVSEPDFDVAWSATPSAQEWAARRWGRGPRVLLVPGGRSKEKQWPGWGEVVPELVRRHHASVIMLGAPWEAQMLRAQGLGDAYTGRDLAKMVALIRSADLVMASDTGPMHLAFACMIPTVALFRRMAPESWGPPIADARFAVRRVPDGVDTSAVVAWVIEAASERIAIRSSERATRPSRRPKPRPR